MMQPRRRKICTLKCADATPTTPWLIFVLVGLLRPHTNSLFLVVFTQICPVNSIKCVCACEDSRLYFWSQPQRGLLHDQVAKIPAATADHFLTGLLIFIFDCLGHVVVRGLQMAGISERKAKQLARCRSIWAIIGSRSVCRRRCYLYCRLDMYLSDRVICIDSICVLFGSYKCVDINTVIKMCVCVCAVEGRSWVEYLGI